jgi:hypothetical protein
VRLAALVQALGEKYGLLPGYEDEKRPAKEAKHKGVGKKTIQLVDKNQQEEQVSNPHPCLF